MSMESTLTEDLARALPGRRGRPWEQAALTLVEAVTPTALPALASAIGQAEAATRNAETCAQYEQARSNLDALRRGERVAVEPTPVPTPPGAGWDVSKKLVRDEKGLIDRIEEHWRPAATGA